MLLMYAYVEIYNKIVCNCRTMKHNKIYLTDNRKKLLNFCRPRQKLHTNPQKFVTSNVKLQILNIYCNKN